MSNDELLDEYIDFEYSYMRGNIDEEDRELIANTLGFKAFILAKTHEEIGILLRERFERMKEAIYGFGGDGWLDIYENTKSIRELFQEKTQKQIQLSSKEIRQQLKHEKNPMRIKQLNRELNAAYKRERGRK